MAGSLDVIILSTKLDVVDDITRSSSPPSSLKVGIMMPPAQKTSTLVKPSFEMAEWSVSEPESKFEENETTTA